MSQQHIIRNARNGSVVLARAVWCQSFWCHFRGLMFRRSLSEGDGLLFVFRGESTSTSSIHMFFVPFAIAAVWMDAKGRVVDAKLARPWRPYYASQHPARYLIEARPSLLDRVRVGDQLAFDEIVE